MNESTIKGKLPQCTFCENCINISACRLDAVTTFEIIREYATDITRCEYFTPMKAFYWKIEELIIYAIKSNLM
ncbi:MAG: hypothetical protein FJZ11_05875 [Candidatus Omnitrophica bacterium]|nr:hypothetical protein [Candidatus Omnitrophota bacterium]